MVSFVINNCILNLMLGTSFCVMLRKWTMSFWRSFKTIIAFPIKSLKKTYSVRMQGLGCIHFYLTLDGTFYERCGSNGIVWKWKMEIKYLWVKALGPSYLGIDGIFSTEVLLSYLFVLNNSGAIPVSLKPIGCTFWSSNLVWIYVSPFRSTMDLVKLILSWPLVGRCPNWKISKAVYIIRLMW